MFNIQENSLLAHTMSEFHITHVTQKSMKGPIFHDHLAYLSFPSDDSVRLDFVVAEIFLCGCRVAKVSFELDIRLQSVGKKLCKNL